MYHNSFNHDSISDLKSGVTKAFRTLRKKGIVARRNFMCCGSCASAAIDAEIKESAPADRPIGAVYWHKQAECALLRSGLVYISFGSSGDEAFGPETKAIGDALCEALRAEGVLVDWDGSPYSCVLACAEGATERVRPRI